ncbi:TPA: hypothetical protein ACG0LC_004487, partial [Citrobacter sedlakii]
ATCTAAGIIGGLTVSLSGAAEVVGDIARGAANFISPPFAQGKIATGSLNVQTNGLPAARAAGRLMTAAENATREKMEAEEKKRREEEEARMSSGMKVLNGVVALGAGKVYHAGSDRTERGVEPISLPIKSNINYRSLWIK